MDPVDLERRRARSFGNHAADYHEHRPDYPAAGIRWALDAAARPVRHVLDLAAGTGKLTESLLDLGFEVVAVEPDDGMLAELASRYPGATTLPGTAERIPLPAAAVDAVLVGQAFHWFDPVPALTEIARVLRPGGALGLLWNEEDTDVEWVAGLRAASRTTVPHGARGDVDVPEHQPFTPPERNRIPHKQHRTIDSVVESFGTYSRMLVVDDAERAEVLERIRSYLRSRPETAGGEFDLPLTTDIIRSTRVAFEDQP